MLLNVLLLKPTFVTEKLVNMLKVDKEIMDYANFKIYDSIIFL